MRGYLAIFLVAAGLAFAAAVPFHGFSLKDMQPLGVIATGRGQAVFLANSVGRAYSDCDRDKGSIMQFASLHAREKLIDASEGGLRLDMAMQAARLAVRFKHIDTMIFVVSAYDGYFRNAARPHGASSWFDDNLGYLVGKRPQSFEENQPLNFEGRTFGPYNVLARTYFVREKAAETCPEKPAVDPVFLRFMEWQSLGRLRSGSEGIDAFLNMAGDLKRKGVRTVVVLAPVDVQLAMNTMTPDAVSVMQYNLKQTRQSLAQAHMEVLDLAEAVPKSGFTGEWCACGHLNEAGRRVVADAIAAEINAVQKSRIALRP